MGNAWTTPGPHPGNESHVSYNAREHLRSFTHACTHTSTLRQAHTLTCTQSHVCTRVRAHAHSPTFMPHTHAHTHSRDTRAHTHSAARADFPPFVDSHRDVRRDSEPSSPVPSLDKTALGKVTRRLLQSLVSGPEITASRHYNRQQVLTTCHGRREGEGRRNLLP